ncbi:MAG: UDP-glucose/GDP-mannose dehydrogenase family [Parcubacteria group bacterium Gr01-1014_44]|nr:MAG: UDP-glucose/GDP-mannose dehydrogenase family [Parcubacteria group bacterium Gr01-1014_44]
MSEKIKIGIIGLGMVGTPIKRWFEEVRGYKRGQDLFCYDTDPKMGYFDDVNNADVIFVAVPTPPNPDGSCNISIVDNALSRLAGHKIVVIKSTIPPGTTEMFQQKYPRWRILFNPEFLTESRAWEDFLHPTRQLIGYTEKSKGDSAIVLNLLPQGNFSSPWAADYSRFELTATEAEFVKYFSNVFGAVKVTLANIFYDVCEAMSKQSELDVDYENIRTAVGADPRIGPSWLDVHHGVCRGYTGFCFPKDMNGFIAFGEQLVRGSRDGAIQTALLSCGVDGVLSAVRRYNTALLMSQNRTEEDVSKHDKDITLKKEEL